MRIYTFLSLMMFGGLYANAQNKKNDDYVYWSSTRKLTVDDFKIKTKNLENGLSFAQFSIQYEIKGFDFIARNLNKRVSNLMLKSASWIDTTKQTIESLSYQQTLFDISEIYCRQFRREIKENKRKIASGFKFLEEIDNRITTDFTKRRMQYDLETKEGRLKDEQKEWEIEIHEELEELEEFAVDESDK